MAKPKPLQLYIEHLEPNHVITANRPDGSSVVLPGLRVVTYANFLRSLTSSFNSRQYAICEFLVDTGSYLSIIPQALWQLFLPGVVTPLAFDPLMPKALRVITIGAELSLTR